MESNKHGTSARDGSSEPQEIQNAKLCEPPSHIFPFPLFSIIFFIHHLAAKATILAFNPDKKTLQVSRRNLITATRAAIGSLFPFLPLSFSWLTLIQGVTFGLTMFIPGVFKIFGGMGILFPVLMGVVLSSAHGFSSACSCCLSHL